VQNIPSLNDTNRKLFETFFSFIVIVNVNAGCQFEFDLGSITRMSNNQVQTSALKAGYFTVDHRHLNYPGG